MENIFKRIISVFLAITIIFSSAYVGLNELDFSGLFAVEAKAASESDLTFELSDYGESCFVTDCNEDASGEIVIPDTYKGLPVTEIDDYAFSGCNFITTIKLGENIRYCSEVAFDGCDNLININVSAGNENFSSMDGVLFDDDKSILVRFPEGKQGVYIIPDGVRLIDNRAFTECEKLTDVTIPESVFYIGEYAFHESGITSLILPDTVEDLWDCAFSYCKNLKTVKIGSGITELPSSSFGGCESLEYVEFGENITRIGNGAFSGCSSLKNIEFIESITDIGDWSFSDCIGLTNVDITRNITNIGEDAFRWCDNLSSVNVDSENTVYASVDGLLYNKDKTTLIYCPTGKSGQVIIGDTVTDISAFAFNDCNKLTKVIIGENVVNIGESAFDSCDNISEVIIPDSVVSIGADAFSWCGALSNVTIGKGVTEIGEGAFDLTTALQCFVIDSENTVYSSKDGVLFDKVNSILIKYPSLKKDVVYSIPEGTLTIANDAFNNCDYLLMLKIPDSVTTIGEGAIATTDLKYAEIGTGLCDIGYCAFPYRDMAHIVYYGSEEDWNDISIDASNDSIYAAEIHYGAVVGDTSYEVTEPTCTDSGEFKYHCNICDSEFTEYLYSTGHKGVTIGTFEPTCSEWGYTEEQCFICNEIFKNYSKEPLGHNFENDVCSVCGSNGLSFELNENGTEYVVAECDTNVSWDIIIPSTYKGLPVTRIDNNCFWYCTNLKSISIPNSITSIGYSAFRECTNLTSITIPDSVTNIDTSAFRDCTNLMSIRLSKNITNIGYGTFTGCTNLTEIIIPNSVKSIDENAFNSCTSLVSIEIPDNVTSIGERAFAYCDNLISIELSNSITTIGERAIFNCKKLNSIVIPSSVTNIGNYAFGYFYNENTRKTEKLEGFTIYGAGGTSAETYAKDNNLTFIDKNHKHTPSSWITDKKATVNAAGKKHKECTECGEVLETAKIAQLKCSKPKLSKIENTEYGVKITWGKVSGADKYYVYRKTGSSGKYSKIATTTKTYYTDKKASSGKKYYYYVKAVNEAGSSSASSSKSIYYLADTTLSTPKSTKNGITLKWKKVTGADGYMVYRKTGSGSYKKIATVKGSTKVTYTDKSAKKGKKYTYKIKAYKSKTYSAYSNTKTIKDKY